jgi:N-acetylglucosaminyldiphosphoundecaprenol N-acetyl-beta-D-mannosaminyltransferase
VESRRVLERIRLVSSPEEERELIDNLRSFKGAVSIGFVNAHAMNLMHDDSSVATAFDKLSLQLRDGKGMELLFKSRNIDPGLNMNGTDFIPKFLNGMLGKKIAILGTCDPWLEKAGHILREEGHNVAMLEDGFKGDEHYLNILSIRYPEVVVLAMGMPKQEKLAHKIIDMYGDRNVIVLCGGAIVDFISGRFSRAPLFVQGLGLEWLYRLINEPGRLFKRYVVGNFVFIYRYILRRM